MFEYTPLKPVSEWVFNRYRVKFTNGEDGPVVMERDFIGTDGPGDSAFHVEWGGMQWPRGASHYEWELVQENVRVRRTQTRIGVVVEGDGWQGSGQSVRLSYEQG